LINDSNNSGGSQPFSGRGYVFEVAAIAALSAIVVVVAAAWIYAHGFVLYYGDAQAHLNSSRGIIDSRTPGYEQIGSVWLPVLHAICLPFVGNDFLWHTGLAGTIPVALCFVAALVFFYLAAREAYGTVLPAVITVACLALNPNLLYLASIPMTEVVFFAGLSAQLFALLRFRRTQNERLILLAAFASIWSSLTRYDGWFLIPFVAIGFWLFAKPGRRLRSALIFGTLASLAPVYWIAHNQWATGDPLSFYHGPYSAKAIYERGLAAGQPRDPGDHHWRLAVLYYFTAGRFCTGWPLLLIGIAGTLVAVVKRSYAPVLFLLLTPCFYIWSMHSSGNPIHIPNLWPFSYYNTRYGIAVLPLCAFGAGAIAAAIPGRWRHAAVVLPALAVAPWLIHPSVQNWICWKESEVNSNSRRFWIKEAAQFFVRNYRTGDGILYAEGDIPGILCRNRTSLSETLNQGNGPAFLVNAYRPDLVRSCKWAVVMESDRDPLARLIDKGNWRKIVYQPVLEIHTKYDPVVRIYRRVH
jgi:hypothetical protein